jgi:hypothetical protein
MYPLGATCRYNVLMAEKWKWIQEKFKRNGHKVTAKRGALYEAPSRQATGQRVSYLN